MSWYNPLSYFGSNKTGNVQSVSQEKDDKKIKVNVCFIFNGATVGQNFKTNCYLSRYTFNQLAMKSAKFEDMFKNVDLSSFSEEKPFKIIINCDNFCGSKVYKNLIGFSSAKKDNLGGFVLEFREDVAEGSIDMLIPNITNLIGLAIYLGFRDEYIRDLYEKLKDVFSSDEFDNFIPDLVYTVCDNLVTIYNLNKYVKNSLNTLLRCIQEDGKIDDCFNNVMSKFKGKDSDIQDRIYDLPYLKIIADLFRPYVDPTNEKFDINLYIQLSKIGTNELVSVISKREQKFGDSAKMDNKSLQITPESIVSFLLSKNICDNGMDHTKYDILINKYLNIGGKMSPDLPIYICNYVKMWYLNPGSESLSKENENPLQKTINEIECFLKYLLYNNFISSGDISRIQNDLVGKLENEKDKIGKAETWKAYFGSYTSSIRKGFFGKSKNDLKSEDLQEEAKEKMQNIINEVKRIAFDLVKYDNEIEEVLSKIGDALDDDKINEVKKLIGNNAAVASIILPRIHRDGYKQIIEYMVDNQNIKDDPFFNQIVDNLIKQMRSQTV